MKLIDELFNGYKLNIKSLLEYGFTFDNNTYSYKKKIYNNAFELIITIKDEIIDGYLIDNDFNEEYKQINSDIITGFTVTLKEICEKELIDIRNHCYTKNTFTYDQSNRICSLINDKYNVKPEFLWDSTPDAGVFRNARSNKWFGIIMCVSKNKIIGNDKKKIEVLNVNLSNDAKKQLENKGIYPAYHMNKKYWISIILDDSLSDQTIMDLVDISYNISNNNGHWLVPANPNYYDVVNMFNDSNITNWKQYKNMQVGDTIYLYVGSPYKEIMFKCEILEINIPYDYKNDNLTITNLIKIKLIKKYKEKEFSFERLNELGIKAIRGPRNLPDSIIKILE